MRRSIKILAIGNSFSEDAMAYLWHILRAGGVEQVTLGNLAIGGCPVSLHADHIASGAAAYYYCKNTDGVWQWSSEQTFAHGLLDEAWDIITLQQASHDSGLPETYVRQNEVINYVNAHKRNPDAALYWHMTWAQTLCGVDPDTVDWVPEAFADAIRPDLAYIREAVKAAGNVSLV